MNTKTIKCEICGKEFNTLNKNAKYCCLECRAIGRSYTKRMWLDRKKNYMRDYMRAYRKKNKAVLEKINLLEIPEQGTDK